MHPFLIIATIVVSGVFVLLQRIGSLVARISWRLAAGPREPEYPFLPEDDDDDA